MVYCTGFWETCDCDECILAKDLYKEVAEYEAMTEYNKKAFKKDYESAVELLQFMGYSV